MSIGRSQTRGSKQRLGMRILSHSLSIQTKGMSWGGGVNHTKNLYFDRHLKLDRHNSAEFCPAAPANAPTCIPGFV